MEGTCHGRQLGLLGRRDLAAEHGQLARMSRNYSIIHISIGHVFAQE